MSKARSLQVYRTFFVNFFVVPAQLPREMTIIKGLFGNGNAFPRFDCSFRFRLAGKFQRDLV